MKTVQSGQGYSEGKPWKPLEGWTDEGKRRGGGLFEGGLLGPLASSWVSFLAPVEAGKSTSVQFPPTHAVVVSGRLGMLVLIGKCQLNKHQLHLPAPFRVPCRLMMGST